MILNRSKLRLLLEINSNCPDQLAMKSKFLIPLRALFLLWQWSKKPVLHTPRCTAHCCPREGVRIRPRSRACHAPHVFCHVNASALCVWNWTADLAKVKSVRRGADVGDSTRDLRGKRSNALGDRQHEAAPAQDLSARRHLDATREQDSRVLHLPLRSPVPESRLSS